MKKILIVEDDEMLNSGLCYNLMLGGYETGSASSIKEAKVLFPEEEWSLLLVDVNLSDGNGFEFCQWVRGQSKVPVIFLTGNDLDEDMITGFDVGADDYITKPFNIKIVMRRIDAILKRTKEQPVQTRAFSCGNIDVDFDSQAVKKSGKLIILTPTEYKLLCLFSKHPKQVLSRDAILDALWDKDGNYVDDHTLTINISRLRSKISDEKYTYIKTVYGTGYQWIGESHE